ncbi:MAG: serine hydrolase [Rhodospirillales bacterium]|nr:serine hydrolase [Rhodospirillales bacterium]
MDAWLKAAADYIPRWLEYQMRQSGQPGCVVALAHKGRVVLEKAFGVADVATGRALTPRHRLRVASHSKTFTAVGVMKLREAGLLRLDDPAGRATSTACIPAWRRPHSHNCCRTAPA